jgi:hypothetical protein
MMTWIPRGFALLLLVLPFGAFALGVAVSLMFRQLPTNTKAI